jgi:UDP-4-amino-4,6-dideoxy-N-acetyl-beta-L-altrosamine transaminase
VIPYGRQSIDDDDIKAVVEVLRGDWLTQGPHVETFEAALAARVDARHAVAFSSGTAALHGAMYAAAIGPGDLVVTSPLSFAASANCARYVGADVGFVDIDAATLNLDLQAVPRTATAIVAVHYAGLPVDLDELSYRPRVVIEDAAHALGASTPLGPVGNCARSEMCAFSFHPVKAVTTAEGGAVTTNDDALASRLRRFRNHGMVRRPEVAGWYYEIDELGYNYRLSDLHAALGTSQLRKLEGFLRRRTELADRYRRLLAPLPVELPPAAPPGSHHANHLFVVRVRDRDRVYDELRAKDVGVQVHYVPIYRHPAYQRECDASAFPVTEAVFEGLLSLPLHPSLSDDEQNRVVDALEASLS